MRDRAGLTHGEAIGRRAVLAGAVATSFLPAWLAAARAVRTPTGAEDFLGPMLLAGGWSQTADDNGGGERLPEATVRRWVGLASEGGAQAFVAQGALALTLSIAEWGIAWENAAPADPAGRAWAGPPSIKAGKHLMSYALGGLGLPHLDRSDVPAFFNQLSKFLPASADEASAIGSIPRGFRYDALRTDGGICDSDPKAAVQMIDLDGQAFHHAYPYFGGIRYCERFPMRTATGPMNWQAFRHWARIGLRRRDMQQWVLDYWIEHYWTPARTLVLASTSGTIEEAFIVARIWNSGEGLARKALHQVSGLRDAAARIAGELDYYGRLNTTYRDRLGVMRRPLVAFQHLQPPA